MKKLTPDSDVIRNAVALACRAPSLHNSPALAVDCRRFVASPARGSHPDDVFCRPERAQAPIVLGVDGSPASERATALAFEEASWRKAELVVLHAWSDADWPEVAPIPWSAISDDAEEVLAERLVGWQEQYPDVVVRRLVVRDHPAQNLLVESESAQLVVVGSHGRGGFAGMLLGSVSSAVVHAIHAPVIVARHD